MKNDGSSQMLSQVIIKDYNSTPENISVFELLSDASSISSLVNEDISERNIKNINSTIDDNGRLGEAIYSMFGYPSKIYYKHIAKFVEAYTKEGDLVLDSMAGAGSTAIAALMKGRKCIISDGSAGATFISKCYIMPANIPMLIKEFERIKSKVSRKINTLYQVKCDCNNKCSNFGTANSIIESNIYLCPSCGKEISLYGNENGTRSEYICSSCGFILNISKHEHKKGLVEKRRPIQISYYCDNCICGKSSHTRLVSNEDLALWNKILREHEHLLEELWYPKTKLIYGRAYPRKGSWPGINIGDTVFDLFSKRNLIALAILFEEIQAIQDRDIQELMKFCFLGSLIRASKRVFTTSVIKGLYSIPPVGKEQNVWDVFERKFKSVIKGKRVLNTLYDSEYFIHSAKVFNVSAFNLPLYNDTVDYVFTDPPYGGFVPYYELNLFFSSWLNETEDLENEIIIPMDFDKLPDYAKMWGNLAEKAFGEIFRVLKPGRYCTVLFQSKFDTIWNEFRDIMINRLGFEFEHINSNLRGTTFHTNQENDTNPSSAFITYKKPSNYRNHNLHKINNGLNINERRALLKDLLVFIQLRKEKTGTVPPFREIQSEVIEIVHRKNLDKVPNESYIKELMEEILSENLRN